MPLLYTVNRAAGSCIRSEELDDRCHEVLALVSLEHKAKKLPKDLTQVEMRKLELARAMAADPSC